MTYEQITELVSEIAGMLPYCYGAFAGTKAQPVPSADPGYIVYYFDQSDDVFADNVNAVKIRNLNIEYYTEYKKFQKEAEIEDLLRRNKIPFTRFEAYISSERCWQIAYESEVIIHE